MCGREMEKVEEKNHRIHGLRKKRKEKKERPKEKVRERKREQGQQICLASGKDNLSLLTLIFQYSTIIRHLAISISKVIFICFNSNFTFFL